jgi:ubiquinone/menaquinone biosynthesis C-methylase UbiE
LALEKLSVPPSDERIPEWAWEVVASPGGGSLRCEDNTLLVADQPIGRIDRGILRFDIPTRDASTEYYCAIGGAHFHERSAVPFAMSALDTPVYHDYLREFAPDDHDTLVADIGGGDGRNALPWLQWGFKRVVVVDATAAALYRFRARVLAENPDWLDRLVLIEGDARALPLANGSADRVLAIEALYYLNEEYERGLAECYRVMRPQARFLLADRSYEGALLTRLLYYGGVEAMLETAHRNEMWDGENHQRVRTRFFSREELAGLLAAQGFEILEWCGISAFSLLLSFLSKLDTLGPRSEADLPAVHRLLIDLGRSGGCKRCHVAVAAKPALLA